MAGSLVTLVVRNNDKQRPKLPLELPAGGLHDVGQVLLGETVGKPGHSLHEGEGHDARVASVRRRSQAHDGPRLVVDNLDLGPRVGVLVVGSKGLHDRDSDASGMGVPDPDGQALETWRERRGTSLEV